MADIALGLLLFFVKEQGSGREERVCVFLFGASFV